ncbi:MAG: DMT family transporter [Acidobacteriota bacterium]
MRLTAVIFMLISAAAFAGMGAFVKAATEVPVVEKVVFRNVISLVIAGVVAWRAGKPLLGRRENQKLLLLRSLLGVGGVTCYFYAIDNLILADAAMLNRLSPFFVAILALLFLGERPPKAVIVAMVVAFIGGLLVIKPRFELTILPALVGLASAVFAGGAYTVVRSLRSREAPETIVFYFSLVTVLVLAPFVAGDLYLPNGREVWLLLGIGVGAAIGQFGLTMAYRHAPAAGVSIYSYTTIVFSALLGLLIWAEVPDWLSVIGGVLIIAGGALSFAAERRPQPESAGFGPV